MTASVTASAALGSSSPALSFKILAECSKSKARSSLMTLPHYTVELPAFMPVGTQGTMKGLLPQQVKDAGAQIILGNTYHLGTRPGKEQLQQMGGLHHLMQWDRALLTDSGGFQMVSLLDLAEITEDGVKFRSPYDESECLLTPEESIAIQNTIGADIMMQLDDVVNVTETDYERFKTATYRTTRWLDRCIKANKNPTTQNLFPIVQGGLFPDLRRISAEQLISRDAPGYAIGGLSGGEDKDKFWPVVDLCTSLLPRHKPRYCMGVGFAVDLVVCCALGVDMFDCVFPTRTARFGCALVDSGQINLKSREFSGDLRPIDETCDCSTCRAYTRAYLNTIVTREPVACHLLSVHNIAYQMRLMRRLRESIKGGRFEVFVQEFMETFYHGQDYPKWVTDALSAVNITLSKKNPSEGDGGSRGPKQSQDIWGEEDLNKENSGGRETVTGQQSGFTRISLTGYREAILGDFEEEEESGRRDGFLAGLHADPATNSTLTLARVKGLLAALGHKHNGREDSEEKAEIEGLLKEIEKLLGLCYQPSEVMLSKAMEGQSAIKEDGGLQSDSSHTTPSCGTGEEAESGRTEASCSGKEDECSGSDSCCAKEGGKEHVSTSVRRIVDRTKVLYNARGWSVPEFD